MSANRRGLPIPHNRSAIAARRAMGQEDVLQRMRARDLCPSGTIRDVPVFVWLLLAPVALLALYALVAVLVCAGASVEDALVGGPP